jgi:hypothetical protein
MPTIDVPPSDASPVPIDRGAHISPDPIVEFQIVMQSIDEIPSDESSRQATPLPIPTPPDEKATTCELEIKRTPIEELPPFVYPVPITEASHQPSTIDEFKVSILSTLEVPMEHSPAPIPEYAATSPASIVVFEILMLPIHDVVSDEFIPSPPSTGPVPIRVA